MKSLIASLTTFNTGLKELEQQQLELNLKVDTTVINKQITDLINKYSTKEIVIPVRTGSSGDAKSKQPVKKAAGGLISGPGTGTSDSILAFLSNGEYVIKSAAVKRYGRKVFDDFNAMNLGERLKNIEFGIPHFASGGPVVTQQMIDQLEPASGVAKNNVYLSLPGGGEVGPLAASDDVVEILKRAISDLRLKR